jgi:hypothetical protein
MTIPTLHNCPHSPDGWCLDCVGKLAAERDDLEQQIRDNAEREKNSIRFAVDEARRVAIREIRYPGADYSESG